MRIGIDARTSHWPGIGRFIRELLTRLPPLERRHEYYVYLNADTPLDVDGANVHAIEIAPPIHSVAEQFVLPAQIKRDRLDLFHAPTTLVAPMRRLRCPMIATLHDLLYVHYPQFLPSTVARLYFRILNRRALRNAQRIVTVSDASREDLGRFFPHCYEKAETIYNGIAERLRVVDDPQRLSAFRTKRGLKRDYLLYVGNYKEHKNVPMLVRAYAQLPDAVRQAYDLVILGRRDPKYPEAPRLIESLGLSSSVVMIDHLDDDELFLLYNGATALTVPALLEGFCLPIAEAMACGLPVITSKLSVMPEVVGDAGVFFDPHTIDNMAEAIERVLTDEPLRQQMREKGLVQVQRYSWDAAAEGYLRCYEQVAGRRN